MALTQISENEAQLKLPLCEYPITSFGKSLSVQQFNLIVNICVLLAWVLIKSSVFVCASLA